VTPKITSVWLKDSGYAIEWPVTKNTDNTFSANIKKDSIILNAVKFDSDGKAIAGEYSDADDKTYKVEVDNAGKITTVTLKDETKEEDPWVVLPTTLSEVTKDTDKRNFDKVNSFFDTTVKINKIEKSADEIYFKVNIGLTTDSKFTTDVWVNNEWKLFSDATWKLIEVDDNGITWEGEFTNWKHNYVIKVDNAGKIKIEKWDVVDADGDWDWWNPENLSDMEITEIASATPEQVKQRLWELIEELNDHRNRYIPKRWMSRNEASSDRSLWNSNKDVAWIQKWLVDYQEMQDFWNTCTVNWDYDSNFFSSVENFQTKIWKTKDWLPWFNTLTALQSALWENTSDGEGAEAREESESFDIGFDNVITTIKKCDPKPTKNANNAETIDLYNKLVDDKTKVEYNKTVKWIWEELWYKIDGIKWEAAHRITIWSFVEWDPKVALTMRADDGHRFAWQYEDGALNEATQIQYNADWTVDNS
jgi:hypothetical protein